MTSLFDDIKQFDEGFLAARREAVAVAHKRVQDRVGSYLKIAKSAEEYDARLSFVSDDIRQIIADVADEFSVDHDKLADAIDDALKGDGVTDINSELDGAPSAVGQKAAGGHKDGCECGFCKNKGNLPGTKKDDNDDSSNDSDSSDSDDASSDDNDPSDEGDKPDFLESKDSSTKEADAPKDGGGAVKRESLPTGDGKSIGTGPSPKIDKKEWKPNALNSDGNLPAEPKGIEMDGSPNPTKTVDLIDDKPDYEGDFLRDTDAVTTQQDLPSADDTGQSTERNISQDGQSSTWTEAQGDAVTSEVFSSVDPDVNPLKVILDSGFATDNQVESAIREFQSE